MEPARQRLDAGGALDSAPEGYGAEENEESCALLASLNAVRETVRAPLMALQRAVQERQGARAQAAALYAFLETIRLPEQLQEKTVRFRAMGENKLADEYAQVWRILCDVLVSLC